MTMAEESGNFQNSEGNFADEHRSRDNSGGGSNNNYEMSSEAMPPVFLGNLLHTYSADAVTDLFERPIQPSEKTNYYPIPVDRIDIKRGYCFVFLKDARSPSDKENVEGFVMDINGMEVPRVSQSLRAEFARGDGRVKKKEDERRRNIQPSETLFVVNFHEETTRQEDLQMLFEPFGQLVRIDMKRNYAFVQFKTIEEASLAKEKTNGGKLDQSVLTVEFVARKIRPDSDGNRMDRRRDDRGGRRDFGRDSRDIDRYDDRRRDGGFGGGGRGMGGSYDNRGPGGYDDRRGRYDEPPPRYDRVDRRSKDPSPHRSVPPRSRSRSRSPVGGRYNSSRSPPVHGYGAGGNLDHRSNDRHGDYRAGMRGPSPPRNDYRARAVSPPRRGLSPPMRGGGRGASPPRDYRDHRGYRH